MSVAFGRCRRILLASALVAAVSLGVTAARADTVNVMLDQARVMKLPERVATIVIGNPLIADASLQAGGILILTGKGYGSTNLVAFDRSGRIVLDKNVQVVGPEGGDIVIVYRGINRESYSCAPECEHRLTLGDSQAFFAQTLQQSVVRSGQAQAAPK
ncbi:MAG TPA: pilus assembly protein N-terminal domain-containing protein [Pseudolabrys sp.]|nr:pilus assembly protein N-terminal domain-containing protein [Pseudolabrys sp.]